MDHAIFRNLRGPILRYYKFIRCISSPNDLLYVFIAIECILELGEVICIILVSVQSILYPFVLINIFLFLLKNKKILKNSKALIPLEFLVDTSMGTFYIFSFFHFLLVK